MPFFKTIQLLSRKMRPQWSRILVLPIKDRIRSYSTCQGQGKRYKSPGFLMCALVSSSALSYTFFKLTEEKFSSLQNVFNFSLPTVSALSFSPNKIDQNRNKYNFIADVVEICAPAVVSVEIRDPKRFNVSNGIPATFHNGSGFIVSEDGLILTNAHVVMKRPNLMIRVRLVDGTTHDATVEALDLEGDLAILRVDKKNLPVIKLGNSKNLRPGEFVIAIGSPLSLSNSITSGVISSTNRMSEELGISRNRMSYIQTDAAITYGNSGGPLVNLEGEVIGINAMKVTSGISFAIPVDYAKEFLEKAESKRKGKVTPVGQHEKEVKRKRYLGVTMLTLTPEILLDLQHVTENVSSLVKHGVFIWRIMGGSPADLGGLKSKDIITHANGEQVTSSDSIYKALEQKDGPLLLTVVRGAEVLQLKINPENTY